MTYLKKPILSSILLSMFSGIGHANETVPSSTLVQLVALSPAIVSQPLTAPNKLVFIWSENCVACQDVFQKEIWPILSDKGRTEAIMVSVIQYEPSIDGIGRIEAALCSDRDQYAWSVLRQLLGNGQRGYIPAIHPPTPDRALRPSSSLCKEPRRAIGILTSFMRSLKDENVSAPPVIKLNGVQIARPFEELHKLTK